MIDERRTLKTKYGISPDLLRAACRARRQRKQIDYSGDAYDNMMRSAIMHQGRNQEEGNTRRRMAMPDDRWDTSGNRRCLSAAFSCYLQGCTSSELYSRGPWRGRALKLTCAVALRAESSGFQASLFASSRFLNASHAGALGETLS